MSKYEKNYVCSSFPGLFVVLLDQGYAMLQPYNETNSRIEVATKKVNRFIDWLIQKAFDGDAPKNFCFVSVIGYNRDVNYLCSGWLKDLDANPLRIDNIKKVMSDGAGGIVEVDVQQPVWVEVAKRGGASNMLGAFQLAKGIIQKWIKYNPQCSVPAVINFSNGIPHYGGKEVCECIKETAKLAKEIMSISNDDGNVLLFNVHVDKLKCDTTMFPKDRSELKQENAQFLFDISSEIPTSLMANMKDMGYDYERGKLREGDLSELTGAYGYSDNLDYGLYAFTHLFHFGS